MARVLRKVVGTSVALAVAVRHLLASTGPGHRVPGVPQAGQRQRCLNCRSVAVRHEDTDCFACEGCEILFGVAECFICFAIAHMYDDYLWICITGHVVDEMRKCPCGRLGESLGEYWFRCREKDCRAFVIAECECGFSGECPGYASMYEGGREWHCELTGRVWLER